MANKVTTTDTTNKVVITPQSSKKLTIDSGDGNNLTLNQSTPNNVQITNNDVDTSLTPNNVSISPTDNNVSLSSISTPVTVNQSSTSIVTVNTVGPQGPKGDNGADGDTLVSNDLENLRSFTGSIQTEVNNLTAATSSYLTSVPDGTISSSAQIIINESQISDLSHTDISALNTFTSSIQIKVDNLTTVTSSYALTTNISGAFNEPSGGFSTRVTTLETAGYITESTDISALNTFTGSIQTEVNNLTAATSSYITESTDISSLNTFTGSIQTEINNLTAATSSYITESTDISSLNTFTSSIQTEVDSLTAATSSYLTEATDISSLNTFTSSIQTEVDSLTAATSSYITESTDISSLNTFTSSIQTEVDNLTAITSSYALTSSISGAFAEPSGGFSNRITTIETNNTGTNTGDQDLSLYALIANISGAFNEPSSSFSTRVTTLETAGYLTSPITTSSITDFNTEVSRSAAAAGFGTGGEDPTDISALNTFTSSIQTEVDNLTTVTGSYALTSSISGAFNEDSSSFSTRITTLEGSNFTPSLSTDIEARNITASGNISASGNITASNIQVANDIELSQQSKIFVGTATEISANGDDYWIVKANGTRVADFKNSGLVINESGIAQVDFRVESDTNSHLLFTDAGANKVAIGTDTVSNSLLTVEGDISASGNLAINQITSSGAVDIGGILSIPGIVNVSASIAAAVAGTGADWNVNLSNIPSGLISESQQITDLGFISESADISALNMFTGSIQTEVDSLTAATSSYITESVDILPLNTFTGSIQTEINNLTAATSSYITESTDISALNTFTGSIQTEVNNLTAETSSYLTELPNGLISESAQFTTSDNFNVGQITSSKLFINPSNGNAEIILDAFTPSYSSQIKFSSFGSTPSWILGMDSVNPQDFRIIKGSVLNNTSGIYITGSTGYVGLGTGTPYERLTVVGNISASGIVYGSTGSFSHLEGNSPITVKDNITFEGNVTMNGAKTTTDSLEITSNTFKLGGGFFTSSSLAAAVGGGGDNLGNHIADTDLNMSTFDITNAGSITAVSLTGSISTSSIEGFDDSVNSLAQTVFDNRDLDSINVLNTFTGSIQTEVDNLTAVTGSYALTSSISGAFAEPSGGFSTRVTTLETAGYITEATDISSLNTFTGSIQTEVDSLTAETSSYLTSPITTSSITDFNTEVSRSVAAAGFGAGDGGGFTPSLSTDIEARNITASGNISASGDISTSGDISVIGSLKLVGNSTTSRIGFSPFGLVDDQFISGFGNQITIDGDNYIELIADNEVKINAPKLGIGIIYSADNVSQVPEALTVEGNISASGDLIIRSITGSIATSSIENFNTEVSRSAAAAGFGTEGEGTPTDISALNIFTGSIQTEVDNLTAATSSYLTSPITTSSITDFNTEVSRSAASAGFGAGDGGFTPSLSTNITALNITASANISASGNLLGNGLVLAGGDGVFTSASLAAAQAGSDNLGNHTATTNLNLDGNSIHAALHITASGNVSASGEITATSFNITGQAADLSIVEGTNELILSSSDVVTVKSPVLNLSSSFGITTGSVVSPYNGYIIYDNDQHKFFGYANGGWVALH